MLIDQLKYLTTLGKDLLNHFAKDRSDRDVARTSGVSASSNQEKPGDGT
jgi:hypothetical protein